ncbi:MAG: ABC transporter ATP-binding protein [Desulfobacteraceae bacterium 4572_123]|nr:MAG: ABC transporter ATP-binding protein [Desulfobacteraceae bacterium 4572_123]
MALISIKNVRLGFGTPLLLDGINLQIGPGEKIGLIGRNGSGKSTFVKLIQGDLLPDQGNIWHRKGLKTAGIPQDVPDTISGTVFTVVALGLGEKSRALAEYQEISQTLSNHVSPDLLERQAQLQQILDTSDGWRLHQDVEDIISRMDLSGTEKFENLSAGLKRRVLLARALVTDPDVLLLDEPTNHLDLDAIAWLENFLLNRDKTLLFITHDRMFLSKLATRIIELDRGQLSSWSCDYRTYIKRRQESLEAEDKQNARFDKKRSKEETWIRQGIKARRTRNEGRVRALKKMRAEVKKRRQRLGTVRMRAQEAQRTGRLVMEARKVEFFFENRMIIRDFATTVMRGDKVGIIGPNGAGKTTLLRILTGELAPSNGVIRHGVKLETAYFDQLRAKLDENKTVQENISNGNDILMINGAKRHVISYLKDFLFSPERSRTPVHILSGGEKNRLLLARLFLKPSNVLVLDEPTNDLDAETLEILEELLLEYKGTVLLVSHDRMFLNNVVTSTLVFEGNGRVNEYVGGYDDWISQRSRDVDPEIKIKKDRPRNNGKPSGLSQSKKLGYMEKRELEALPRRIEELESEQKDLYEKMADPEFYKQKGAGVIQIREKASQLEKALESAYERWETLEAIDTLN